MKRLHVFAAFTMLVLTAFTLAGCIKQPPAAPPPPAPPPPSTMSTPRQAPTSTVRETPPAPPVIPMEPPIGVTGDPLASAAIEAINRDSPLKPAFFQYDSDVLDDAARKIIADNAAVLKRYPTWVISIEGHCDERGSAEYNLALGHRRALAAKNYLVSLGISAERVGTVSFGNEFPFDPASTEAAWALNRRAHSMVTAK